MLDFIGFLSTGIMFQRRSIMNTNSRIFSLNFWRLSLTIYYISNLNKYFLMDTPLFMLNQSCLLVRTTCVWITEHNLLRKKFCGENNHCNWGRHL